jgi:RNA polymerase sigma-70 factor, ECF subfamily
MVREGFLRKALLGSQLTQPLSKCQKNVLHLGQSGDTIRNRLQTKRRQTSSKTISFILRADNVARTEGSDLDTTATSSKLFVPSTREHKTWISRLAPNDANILRQPSDEVLLKSVQEGDKEAIGYLFRRYARALHGIGRRVLGDRAEAEDLVQEVFVYVYRKHSLYDSSKGTARSWIFQIAYTQALLRRRKLKSIGLYSSAIADDLGGSERRSDLPANYDMSVEGLFGRNGWKKIVEDLTEDQRETLRLHFFEGYTFSEIAERLGQTYTNIRNHHYRGLEKLRKHLVKDAPNR